MNRPPQLFFWVLIVLVAAGVATLVVALAPSFGFDMSSDRPVRLIYFAALLLFVGPALVGRGLKAHEVVRAVIGWLVILVVLIGGYAYRHELVGVGGRVLGVLVPGTPISGELAGEARQTVVIMRNGDGHFAVRATVNRIPMTMLVDTGASLVTLTPADAGKIGIDAAKLDFGMPIQTANGLIHAAPITIDRLAIGNIERRQVKALVAPPRALQESLLGMSFLDSLSGYSISGDRLVLKP
jgi:aspartyl protease family protein